MVPHRNIARFPPRAEQVASWVPAPQPQRAIPAPKLRARSATNLALRA
jgi:hypothetical protein